MFEVRCIRTLWCLRLHWKNKEWCWQHRSSSIRSLLLVWCGHCSFKCLTSNCTLPFTARCRRMLRLRWLLQLAALQGGLSFNVGSCDYNRRLWKGSMSFIVSWTAAWHSEHTGCKCVPRWRKLQHPRHRCPNLHQAKPIFHSVPKVLLLNYYKKGNSILPSF